MGEGGEGDQGGDTDLPSNDGWNDDHSNTLWGWLGSVVDGLRSVWESISNLPSLIAQGLKGFFDDVVDAVKALPQVIIDGIKGIFIPDTDYIDSAFDSFVDEMGMKFHFDTDFFEELFQSEQPVEDIEMDYVVPGVGNMHVKVFDSSFFRTGVEYFRPFIRGFLVLMMFLYHVRQLIGFFGYDAGVVAGRTEHVTSARKAQRED